jgi:hypothetical protein
LTSPGAGVFASFRTSARTLRENGHFPSVHCFPECQKSGTRGRRKTLGEERLPRVP